MESGRGLAMRGDVGNDRLGDVGVLRQSAVAIVAVTMAAACGGGGVRHQAAVKPLNTHSAGNASTAGESTSTAIASTTVAPAPTTTVDPTKAAILAAYRASWTDYNDVATHFPVDPTNPILTIHMAGSQLDHVRNALTVLRFQGQVTEGPPPDTSLAVVKQVVGDAAVVADCGFDASTTINAATRQIITPPATQRTLVNAELELAGGVWKVTRSSVVRVGCSASA